MKKSINSNYINYRLETIFSTFYRHWRSQRSATPLRNGVSWGKVWPPRGMACPVSRCNGIMFHTKNKFIQDWEERHRIQARKFLCPVAGCLAESRRKSDIKAHLRTTHEKDPQRLEAILLKCQSVGRKKRVTSTQDYLFSRVTQSSKRQRQYRRLWRRFWMSRTKQGATRSRFWVTRIRLQSSGRVFC